MSGKGGKVIAVSYKDRSSVLLGGRMADAAYCIGPAPAAQSATSPAANPPSANAPAAADGTKESTTKESTKESTTKDGTQKAKKKRTAGVTRRHEIEKSIESGTVPSRYRSSVPKEYQQYIPFSKD